MRIKTTAAGSFAALLAIAATVSPALAQDQLAIEEIRVTATKREANLQDIPMAITAFGRRGLENAGIENVNQLANFVPNMVVGNNNNDTQVMIRGIGTSDVTIVGDPSVAIHVDDLYVTRTSGLNMLMYDTERVEVLRGPQGTLYGRNATGGSVNIISTRPQNEFGINADALYGDYDWFQFRGALNVPLVKEKLAGRLSLVREKRDGYQQNVFPGGTVSNDADALAWRLRFLWTPTEDLSILVKADDVDFDDIGQQRERLESPPGNPANGFQGTLADPAELNSVYKDQPESRDLKSDSQLIRVDWQFVDSIEMTFIAGWTDMQWDFFLDANQDGNDASTTLGNSRVSSDANSQELRLASTTDSSLQWLVGFFHLEEDAEQPLLVVNTPGPTINNGWEMETDSWAAFGQLNYALTDTVRLLGGLRYTDDEKKGRGQQETCIPNFFCPVPLTFIEEQNSWDDVSWLIGADWSPWDNHMFYGKISTGYKAGGFNLIGSPPGERIWDPEEIISYEIGWKGNYLNRRVRLNTAAFHYDYDDLQVSGIVNFARLTTNAAKASVNGIEFESLFQLGSSWIINFSLGWLDAEFDDFTSVDPVNVPQGRVPLNEPAPIPEDFSGNSLINSPDLSANLSVQYTFDLGRVGALTARAQSHWQDDWYHRPYNLAEDKEDSYMATDVRLIWRSPEERWYAEAFVNNISDEEFATSIEVTNGGFFGNINPPRIWGVRLGVNY